MTIGSHTDLLKTAQGSYTYSFTNNSLVIALSNVTATDTVLNIQCPAVSYNALGVPSGSQLVFQTRQAQMIQE